MSRPEFETSRLRSKRAERDGKVHQFVRFVTDGDNPWIWVRNPARVVLFFRHVINDVLFSIVFVSSRSVNWTDDVDLVVLEGNVVFIHVDDVIRIVYPESVEI